MQHGADVGAAAHPEGGGRQQLRRVHPGGHRGPAVDRGEHRSLLPASLLRLLQHQGQAGVQDREVPPGGRLPPHGGRGGRERVSERAPDPAARSEPVRHLA